MILQGILGRSLGGFVCVRGYAMLSDLAKISHADHNYQRDIITQHRDNIYQFLKRGEDLFFPEVTLACDLKDSRNCDDAIELNDNLGHILQGGMFRSEVDGIKVRSRKMPAQGYGDSRSQSFLRVATIIIPDDTYEIRGGKIISGGPLHRIDGNHRLSAISDVNEFATLVTPFSVILFDHSVAGSTASKRSSKVIFHNINSKGVRLTSEENLKGILDDSEHFTDEYLLESKGFGQPYLWARQTVRKCQENHCSHATPFKDQSRTVLVELFQLLVNHCFVDGDEEKADVSELAVDCVERVVQLWIGENVLQDNQNAGLFVAMLFFAYADATNHRFKPFMHWVKGNHLAKIESINAESLIKIFECVYLAKSRTIFVSMPFNDETKDTYYTIENAVTKINDSCKLDIRIVPLRIDKQNHGHSFQILDEILKAIDDSGLFIADLTQGNKNVYHEIGYLMGLNQGRGLAQENFLLIVKDRGKEQLEKDIGFNLSNISQVRFKDAASLETELMLMIKKYYGLDWEA